VLICLKKVVPTDRCRRAVAKILNANQSASCQAAIEPNARCSFHFHQVSLVAAPITAAVLNNSFCVFQVKPYKKNMREHLSPRTGQRPGLGRHFPARPSDTSDSKDADKSPLEWRSQQEFQNV